MSIFFKARSGKYTASAGLLIIRIALGSLFLFAGSKKVLDLQAFIQSVQDTGQMSSTLSFILAFILPFMEMLFGALLIIGLFTPLSAFFISVMCVSFIIVGGPGHPELPFSYNFVLLATSIGLMFTGAGLFSFDAFMDKGKDKERRISVINDPVVTTNSTFANQKVNESDAIYVDEKELAKGEDVSG